MTIVTKDELKFEAKTIILHSILTRIEQEIKFNGKDADKDVLREMILEARKFMGAYGIESYQGLGSVNDNVDETLQEIFDRFDEPFYFGTSNRESLVRLVKEYGVFQTAEEYYEGDNAPGSDEDAVLLIDLVAAGYYKPHIGIDEVVSELYPDYSLQGVNFGPSHIFSPWPDGQIIAFLHGKAKKERQESKERAREHWEQKALAHIKESSEFIFYGDTSLPDNEKEAVCKITLKPSSLCDSVQSDIYETCQEWLFDIAKYKQDSEFIWEDGHAYTVEDTVYIVLVSRALLKRKLREFCESF